jgi:hypothetical protein
MRKLIAALPAAAVIAVGAAAVLQTSASAATTTFLPPGSPASQATSAGTSQATTTRASQDAAIMASRGSPADLFLTTTMISYKAIDVPPAGLSPGDGYVLAGHVSRHGMADGLSTAQCTYTSTTGPVLRLCTVDYALANGLVITSGYIHGPARGAPVTLVVDGGTGAYKNARGYGTLQPTSTGSNVALYLTR